MKCKYCRWTGAFKSFGRHLWEKHPKIARRNLRKAQTPAARKKAAATRARNASELDTDVGVSKSARGRRKRSGSVSVRENAAGVPECPPGYVVDTITWKRAT
jgi:hypothetical protein